MLKFRKTIGICLQANKYNVKLLKFSSMGSSDMKEAKIRVGDCNINYLKVGNGSHSILCLPGALGSIWTDFKPQIEGLDREKFTIVAWDPPGYGKSRPPNKEFSLDFYEKDAYAAALFMRTLNIDKYSLLGWSDGGITAMIASARYPDNVEKLVIWGSNSFIMKEELESYQKIRDVTKWSEKMRKPMEELYGEEFPTLWSQWTDAMVNIFNKKKGDICMGELEKIKCPTLIMHGEKDPMVDNCHIAHLHTHISNSRIHLYPEGKHNVHLRYAEDFNKRVEQFLLSSQNSLAENESKSRL